MKPPTTKVKAGPGRPKKDGTPNKSERELTYEHAVKPVEMPLGFDPFADDDVPLIIEPITATTEDIAKLAANAVDRQMELDMAGLNAKQKLALRYDIAKTNEVSFKALAEELKFRVNSKRYVDREAMRQAQAWAWAELSQTFRSIPDTIERRLGCTPMMSQQIGDMLDDAMNDLSEKFEKMLRDL